MSGALAHARGLFVEAPARSAAAAPLVRQPQLAVLCSPARAHAAAASVALALAETRRTPCSLACAIGCAAVSSASLTPGARRAAARLRRRGESAAAVGRLVWLVADAPDVGADPDAGVAADADRPAGARPDAAGASLALGRAARAVTAPAVLAIPFARTAAIDRVLAAHDAIVVVREADVPARLSELVLASLGELGRPVVAMDAPSLLAARMATAGLRAPATAADAVARLRDAGGLP